MGCIWNRPHMEANVIYVVGYCVFWLLVAVVGKKRNEFYAFLQQLMSLLMNSIQYELSKSKAVRNDNEAKSR